MCFKIHIKDYAAKDGYYRLTIDKTEYDRNNFNLYYLIKCSYLSKLQHEENDLTAKLIAFENNLQKANLKGEIFSNKGQVFVFDEKGNFQTFSKEHVEDIQFGVAIKHAWEKIKEFFNNKIKIRASSNA